MAPFVEARFQEDIQCNYRLLADFYWRESQPMYPVCIMGAAFLAGVGNASIEIGFLLVQQ